MLSVINVFTLSDTQLQSDEKNNSFHRIDADVNSDVSDESDIESELNVSNMSDRSRRSMWNDTTILNSTLASKAPSIISTNRSFYRKPFTASTQSINSIRTIPNKNTSFGSVRDLRDNRLDLSLREQLNRSAFTMASPASNFVNRKQCLTPLSGNFSHTDYADTTIRCSSRNSNYEIPDDVESGITQLSISGLGEKQMTYGKQAGIFGSPEQIRDSLRYRKPIISPSRLSMNENHLSVNQSSWLAGGYWNNTSPQKKCMLQQNQLKCGQKVVAEVFPLMSRTSSHSSGFESMQNSTNNNSRENSLCDERDLEKTSLFDDSLPMNQSAISIVKPQPQRKFDRSSMNGVSSLSIDYNYKQRQSPRNFDFKSIQNKKLMPTFLVKSHSLDHHSHHPSSTSQMPLQFQNNADKFGINEQLAMNFDSFTKFNKDLPFQSFQRGSLIKLHDNATTDKN